MASRKINTKNQTVKRPVHLCVARNCNERAVWVGTSKSQRDYLDYIVEVCDTHKKILHRYSIEKMV